MEVAKAVEDPQTLQARHACQRRGWNCTAPLHQRGDATVPYNQKVVAVAVAVVAGIVAVIIAGAFALVVGAADDTGGDGWWGLRRCRFGLAYTPTPAYLARQVCREISGRGLQPPPGPVFLSAMQMRGKGKHPLNVLTLSAGIRATSRASWIPASTKSQCCCSGSRCLLEPLPRPFSNSTSWPCVLELRLSGGETRCAPSNWRPVKVSWNNSARGGGEWYDPDQHATPDWLIYTAHRMQGRQQDKERV
eukprot:366190-Chlamydomonas_euryale.AAC.13